MSRIPTGNFLPSLSLPSLDIEEKSRCVPGPRVRARVIEARCKGGRCERLAYPG